MLLSGKMQMTETMITQRNNLSIPRQQGVGLIDVLVAIVIFSFGMLAIAALQTISKQSNYEALQRTNASNLAYDLLERMRMNSVDMVVSPLSYYVSSGTTTITADDLTVNGSSLSAAVTCGATDMDCNYQRRAELDLLEWQDMMRGASEKSGPDRDDVGGLFQPTACLRGPGLGNSGAYTLTIVWRGQARLTNQSTNQCGSGSSLYDDASSDDFAYRRILVLNTYLNE